MSLQWFNENRKVFKFVSGDSREASSQKRFSSTCLPSIDALSRLGHSKNNPKYKLDPTCLLEFGPIKSNELSLPYFVNSVSAGYPSAVDDPYTRHLDLTKYLIRHPKTTYYFKATGFSMIDAGICEKDILVVDTALKPKHGDVVIAVVNEEITVKRAHMEGSQVIVLSDNSECHFVTINKEINFSIQGVVTTVIRTFNPLP